MGRFRENSQEANIKREALIKEILEFLRKVLPKINHISRYFLKLNRRIRSRLIEQTPHRRFEVPSTSDTKDDIYGEIDSPFLGLDMRLLDTQYGIGKDCDNFKIGNSTVTVDNISDISIRGKQFKGTEDLWKLLTRKTVNYDSIDEKIYKNIRQFWK